MSAAKRIYLYPGMLAVSAEAAEITTILGSCVSVALYDRVRKIGGLNHYLLPQVMPGEANSLRYGSFAIPELIQALRNLGGSPKNFEAKIFGGADVLGDLSLGTNIGKKNAEIARELLADAGIPILQSEVGGTRGRKVVFHTDGFRVLSTLQGSDARSAGSSQSDTTGFQKLQDLGSVRVVIVDPKHETRAMFQKIFTSRGFQVVGLAADAFEARELIVRTRPDVVTLEAHLPKMNGLKFLERLMTYLPTPVVMVSDGCSDSAAAMQAVQLGAVEFLCKPKVYDPNTLCQLTETLVTKVKAAAAKRVLLERKRDDGPQETYSRSITERRKLKQPPELIVVSGNAGSFASLRKFIEGLPASAPPVVVANGSVAPILKSFILSLSPALRARVAVAESGLRPQAGRIYMATSEGHVEVQSFAARPELRVRSGSPVEGQLPSGDCLFSSASKAIGKNLVAVLLGGYGEDGVKGLAKVQAGGGLTLVEHPDHAEFPYAPQKALALGFSDSVLTVEHMIDFVFSSASGRKAA